MTHYNEVDAVLASIGVFIPTPGKAGDPHPIADEEKAIFVPPVSNEPEFTGKVTPTLFEPGSRAKTNLSIWRKNGDYSISVRNAWGSEHYGIFTGPYVAEGQLHGGNTTPEGKEFRRRVFDLMVEPFNAARPATPDPLNDSHTALMTPLWSQWDRQGRLLPHTMLGLLWDTTEGGYAFPVAVVILDGEDTHTVMLTRNEGVSPTAPSYVGKIG